MLLSNFTYTVHDRLSWPLLGSQRCCHVDVLCSGVVEGEDKLVMNGSLLAGMYALLHQTLLKAAIGQFIELTPIAVWVLYVLLTNQRIFEKICHYFMITIGIYRWICLILQRLDHCFVPEKKDSMKYENQCRQDRHLEAAATTWAMLSLWLTSCKLNWFLFWSLMCVEDLKNWSDEKLCQ